MRRILTLVDLTSTIFVDFFVDNFPWVWRCSAYLVGNLLIGIEYWILLFCIKLFKIPEMRLYYDSAAKLSGNPGVKKRSPRTQKWCLFCCSYEGLCSCSNHAGATRWYSYFKVESASMKAWSSDYSATLQVIQAFIIAKSTILSWKWIPMMKMI